MCKMSFRYVCSICQCSTQAAHVSEPMCKIFYMCTSTCQSSKSLLCDNVQNLLHVHKHMLIFQNVTLRQCFVCLLTLILCNAAPAKNNISLLWACVQCAARADIPKNRNQPICPLPVYYLYLLRLQCIHTFNHNTSRPNSRSGRRIRIWILMHKLSHKFENQ